jgi:hypothetical protein
MKSLLARSISLGRTGGAVTGLVAQLTGLVAQSTGLVAQSTGLVAQ